VTGQVVQVLAGVVDIDDMRGVRYLEPLGPAVL